MKLLGKTPKVGYQAHHWWFQEVDNHIKTITSHFNPDLAFEDAYAFQRSEVIQNENRKKKIMAIEKCWKNGLITHW
jgi:phosphate acetyltransferase